MTDIELVIKKGEEDRLYQWDTDRQIKITTDLMVDEVQFDTILSKSLIVKPRVDVKLGGVVADIPNILLQGNMEINVYVIMHTENGKHVTEHRKFEVIKRKKPSDYIYTETEVLSYESLEKRVSELEQSGGTGGILKETDPTVPDWAKKPTKPSYTAEEVGALPEDTEIPDITALEDRVSKLERGGASGGTYIEPEWEKVAEIPMNTETVIYELASTNDYHDILVAIKRVKEVTGSGNTFLRLISDRNTAVTKITNLLVDFGRTNIIARLSINGDIVETIQKSSNNIFTGTTIYSFYDDVTHFKNDSKFAIVTSEEWAQATSDGDTITVYGKRRQS